MKNPDLFSSDDKLRYKKFVEWHSLATARVHVLFDHFCLYLSACKPSLHYFVGYLSYFGFTEIADTSIKLVVPGFENASIGILSMLYDSAFPFILHFWKYRDGKHTEWNMKLKSLDDISDSEIVNLADRWFFPDKYRNCYIQLTLF